MSDVQGYLAQKTPTPQQVPTVALFLGTYGDPGGVGVSYKRSTPVGKRVYAPPVIFAVGDFAERILFERLRQGCNRLHPLDLPTNDTVSAENDTFS